MMTPTLFKVGLLLLSQLHLTWAMILPRHPLISCTGGNPAVAGDTCASFASKWNLNETLFTSLNPDINCSNLVAGYYYCVVGWDLRAPTPAPTTVPTLIPRAPATSSLASNEPQESPRFAANCIGFQLAQQHDDCSKFGIARDVFLDLNPVINQDCTNLIAGLAYCGHDKLGEQDDRDEHGGDLTAHPSRISD
ncbi:hypothetical protein T069G_03627 [Trichoderma breve]|uniref:LysM domain-containing protein n=1 Tax=Trichoderma breve TaxID=2034170 RepID=A0A9W9BG09_9HYPO|nr:hypothetical protein T069G_03627 [Trichoderma breve]KAJ4862673.1 hypothetical protein T069G_03627 [Trichoderma breve]